MVNYQLFYPTILVAEGGIEPLSLGYEPNQITKSCYNRSNYIFIWRVRSDSNRHLFLRSNLFSRQGCYHYSYPLIFLIIFLFFNFFGFLSMVLYALKTSFKSCCTYTYFPRSFLRLSPFLLSFRKQKIYGRQGVGSNDQPSVFQTDALTN